MRILHECPVLVAELNMTELRSAAFMTCTMRGIE